MYFTHLFKVWTWKIPPLFCYFDKFFFSIHEYLQFSKMWILWDWKCEYGCLQITHAKNFDSWFDKLFWHLWFGKTHSHISSSQYSLNVLSWIKHNKKLPWFLLPALPPIFTYDEKRIANDKTESGTKPDKKGQYIFLQ